MISESKQQKTIRLLPNLCLDGASSKTTPAMREHLERDLAKWPFLLGDALLLAVAFLIYGQSTRPMNFWQVALTILCVAGGVCLSLMPFLLEYWVAVRGTKAREQTVVEQLRKLESVAAQITTATGQSVEGQAGNAATTARGFAEPEGGEAQHLREFMGRPEDSQKAHAPSAAEELARPEASWLEVLVQVLDHIYSLHVGAVHLGQPALIEQLSHFQSACWDATRRIELRPFIAEPKEPFDAQRHKQDDGEGPVPAKGTVAETITPGYAFQGRLLRRALVRLAKGNEVQSDGGQTEGNGSRLDLEAPEPTQQG